MKVKFGKFAMFKVKFEKLCNDKNVPPSTVCRAIGITPSAYSQWTDSTVPRRATLAKIADYFGVSVSYLTDQASGDTDEPSPAPLGNAERAGEANTNVTAFAHLAASLPEEDQKLLLDYVCFLKSRHKS